jgi:hypothetical protein
MEEKNIFYENPVEVRSFDGTFSSIQSTQQTAQVDYDLSTSNFKNKIHQKVQNN